MDWVEAQLDEVTSSLTNLPKLQVLYPDFSGVIDGAFQDYPAGSLESFEK